MGPGDRSHVADLLRGLPRRRAWILIGAAVFGPTVVAAHTLLVPRVLQLRIGPQTVELGLGQRVHAGPQAMQWRERFDQDRSGTLSNEERAALAAAVHDDARALVRLWLDGVPIALQPELEELVDEHGGTVQDGQGWSFRSISLIATCPRPGLHTLRIADAPDGGRVEPVRLELARSLSFGGTSACEGAAPFAAAEGAWVGGFAAGPGWIEVRFEVPERRGEVGGAAGPAESGRGSEDQDTH